MLRLRSISLTQFRNYMLRAFSFTEKITGICGLNGTGKTNLLDAIYYLSFSKSYFSRPDQQNVHHGTSGMRLEALYDVETKEHELVCILRENNRKEMILDGEVYKKFSHHIGRFPCVMIAPDDIALVTGGGEERRKFIDTILSQLDQAYLKHLIDYTKLLQQRNSLLKQMSDGGMEDESLLDVLNEQLSHTGTFLFEQRQSFLKNFLQLTGLIYTRIAGKDDGLQLGYESQLLYQTFPALLHSRLQKDKLVQRTTGGIHRDDLLLMMDTAFFKAEASQGQRKSLLFALKLAEWQVLKDKKGFPPILLLDDVFEKLDEQRMQQLLHWVCTESDGQVFITDTHEERLKTHLEGTGNSYQLINLDKD